MSGKPLFDAQGRFTGYRGVGRNITERKRTKRSLREIAERFRSLTELSSDWYWKTDATLRFTYVSEGIRRWRGVGPEPQRQGGAGCRTRRGDEEWRAIAPRSRLTCRSATSSSPATADGGVPT